MTAEMNELDLRRHALNLLGLAKKFLREDGDLDPTAFVITADDQLLRPIELQDESRKTESCSKVVAEARKKNALAIITIFLARSKDFDREKFDEEVYLWGDIQDKSADRCILVTVSGPGIKNWAVSLPFKIRNGKVAFKKRFEFRHGVDLGLFPGWAEQITTPKGS